MALLGTLDREQTVAMSMMIGKILLRSGAETSRVEDTVNRFCTMNGFPDVGIFVTPTFVVIGDEKHGDSTIVTRVRYRNTCLCKISEINDFTFNLHNWDKNYDETMAYLEELLNRQDIYDKWLQVLAAGIGAALFSMLLGGNIHDFIATVITCGLAKLLLTNISGYRPGVFWETALAGATIGVVALICCVLDGQCTQTNIIVGALMPFLPGVAFTNASRDYIAGDLISGNSRSAEAILLATSIAVGLAASLLAWRYWF